MMTRQTNAIRTHASAAIISAGRYLYHLTDIAEIEAMKGTIPAVHLRRLMQMKDERDAFEQANPDEAKRIRETKAAGAKGVTK